MHLRPANTIRSHLVHPKDKVDKLDKCGVVYHVQCDDCSADYVGETARALTNRLKEHKKTTSHVGQHLKEHKHQFLPDKVAVLHQEASWFKRGVAEALYIAQKAPTLNHDRGRHTLPVIYREIMQPRDLDARPVTGSTSGSRDHVSLAAQSQLNQH